MSRRIAYPFLTLSDDALQAGPWELSLDGVNWETAGDYLPRWDAAATVRCRREFNVVPDAAASELALPPDQLALALTGRVGTGPGAFPRRVIFRERQLIDTSAPRQHIEFCVPGTELSEQLELRTDVTLALATTGGSSLSPRVAGSRLWSDIQRVRIEGDEPRFPIEAVDLKELLGGRLAANAPWYLHWSPDHWERDFHGAVRLYLNRGAQGIHDRLIEEDSATLQVLLGEVISQVCERYVLAHDSDYRPVQGSLGAQAETWLNRAFPDQRIVHVKSLLETQPGVFRASLMALARLGDV